jgi:hypothetical protein
MTRPIGGGEKSTMDPKLCETVTPLKYRLRLDEERRPQGFDPDA